VALGVVEKLEVVHVIERNAVALSVSLGPRGQLRKLLAQGDAIPDVGERIVAGFLE